MDIGMLVNKAISALQDGARRTELPYKDVDDETYNVVAYRVPPNTIRIDIIKQ